MYIQYSLRNRKKSTLVMQGKKLCDRTANNEMFANNQKLNLTQIVLENWFNAFVSRRLYSLEVYGKKYIAKIT